MAPKDWRREAELLSAEWTRTKRELNTVKRKLRAALSGMVEFPRVEFSGHGDIYRRLPKDTKAWIDSLSECGEKTELGVGEIVKIRRYGAACYRAGMEATLEKMGKRRYRQ